MGFSIDTRGLTAASSRLEVVGNNISNANSTGFKGANFSNTLANVINGGAIGSLPGSRQSFNQGAIEATGNPLDIAVNGRGFFRVETQDGVAYTRDGQFLLDKDGRVINSAGDQLTGFGVNADGVIVPGVLVPLTITTDDKPPVVTTEATLALTLDSREEVPTAAFNAGDPTTYNHSTTTAVYDELGDAHYVQTYYVKTAANAWEAYASVDGGAAASLSPLAFGNDGLLTTTPAEFNIDVTLDDGTIRPVSFDLSAARQYATPFVATMEQNGSPLGQMLGYEVDKDGQIMTRYSNGETAIMGQVVLSNFESVDGLKPTGNNQWVETFASGEAQVYLPGTAGQGVLEASAIETSNIDLTSELIKLIEAQRIFQASAELVRKQDEITQTTVQITR